MCSYLIWSVNILLERGLAKSQVQWQRADNHYAILCTRLHAWVIATACSLLLATHILLLTLTFWLRSSELSPLLWSTIAKDIERTVVVSVAGIHPYCLVGCNKRDSRISTGSLRITHC